MATTFRTPGVYIQEIDSFPPSINAVETAIPAFIGYTQLDQNGTLHRKPQKISSLLDYVRFYGTGPGPEVDNVQIDSSNNFKSATLQIKYKMYDSVSLFYANGGGDCFVVSAGTFPVSSPGADDFLLDSTSPALLSPLHAIAKEDEPTLLVFPDNALLGTAYFEVYQAALEQCATLQNRFLVCDVDVDPNDTSGDPGAQFRNDIGINHLSYGAAYIPWVNVVSPKAVSYSDFKGKVYIGNTQVTNLANLTTDATIIASVNEMDNLLQDATTITSDTTSLTGGADVGTYYDSLKTAFQNAKTAANLRNIMSFAYSIADKVNNFAQGTTLASSWLKGKVSNMILSGSGTHFADLYTSLVPYNNLAEDATAETAATAVLDITAVAAGCSIDTLVVKTSNTTTVSLLSAAVDYVALDTPYTFAARLVSAISATGFTVTHSGTGEVTVTVPGGLGKSGNNYVLQYTKTGAITITQSATANGFTGGVDTGITGYSTLAVPSGIQSAPAGAWSQNGTNPFTISGFSTVTYTPGTANTVAARAADVLNSIDPIIAQVLQLYSGVVQTAQVQESNIETMLSNSFPVFKNIVAGINSTPISLPPSGAMVGLYAAVDNDRGVWKAPANVSVNNVLGPDATFTNGELDGLNIDVNAGKSINAIRPFKGKGTLVYGARTLAGNDNNWRYVNVRRFYIMVEQSVKKAIESFVFEPNDANTWNRTKAMVDAFLFQQWRAGALQGSKPGQAYYVKVGLGETMVAQDVLEGRMIVEIGMAVVRPAEFIVLRFAQIMPQS